MVALSLASHMFFFFYIVICDVIFRLINGTPSSSKLGVQYSWVDIYGLNIGLLEKTETTRLRNNKTEEWVEYISQFYTILLGFVEILTKTALMSLIIGPLLDD